MVDQQTYVDSKSNMFRNNETVGSEENNSDEEKGFNAQNGHNQAGDNNNENKKPSNKSICMWKTLLIIFALTLPTLILGVLYYNCTHHSNDPSSGGSPSDFQRLPIENVPQSDAVLSSSKGLLCKRISDFSISVPFCNSPCDDGFESLPSVWQFSAYPLTYGCSQQDGTQKRNITRMLRVQREDHCICKKSEKTHGRRKPCGKMFAEGEDMKEEDPQFCYD